MTASPTRASGTAPVQEGGHLCLVYDRFETQMAALLPFLKQGIEQGDRCLYVAAHRTADQVAGALAGAGIDVSPGEARASRVLLRSWDEFRPSGGFDPAAIVGLLRQLRDRAQADG